MTANTEQSTFWNADPGQNWVRHQADLDTIMSPVTDLLLRAAAPLPGEQLLDIGCGAGASSFALAEAVGPAGHVLGLDISDPLLARAEARRAALGLTTLTFTRADAQDHPFPPARFDLAASRFGVMFFADPVAAFANIGRALRPGGRVAFAAWAAIEHNPWFALPRRAALDRLGPVAPGDPDAPGPMAFRDIARVRDLLTAAGFTACAGDCVATQLFHPGGVAAITALAGEIGPLGGILRERNGTETDRAAILDRLARDLAPFARADGIHIPAAINIFTAIRP